MAYLKMSGFVSANVVRKPATRLYPFTKRASFKGSRGRIMVDMPLCNQCTLCMLKCPTGAITVDKAGKTWQINRMLCVLCGECVKVCMRKAVVMRNVHAPPVTAKRIEIFKSLEDMTVVAWDPPSEGYPGHAKR